MKKIVILLLSMMSAFLIFSACSTSGSTGKNECEHSWGGWIFTEDATCLKEGTQIHITIPNGVKSIESGVFNGCSSLKSILIANNVTIIENHAFAECNSLISITIPNGVTSIGDYAFANCSNLMRVVIGNGITTIGKYAFKDSHSLTTVYYTGELSEWEKVSVDYGNYNLTSATWYYYSEEQPSDTDYLYWHYVDGLPTIWQ